jgi:hypothetical protein
MGVQDCSVLRVTLGTRGIREQAAVLEATALRTIRNFFRAPQGAQMQFMLSAIARDLGQTIFTIWLARQRVARAALLSLFLACSSSSFAQTQTLKNNQIMATFGERGLTLVSNLDSSGLVHIKSDEFSISIDQDRFDSAKLAPEIEHSTDRQITYAYQAAGYTVKVVYELKPDWRFVTKQLQITETPKASYKVRTIEPVHMEVTDPIESRFTPGTYLPQYGALDPQSLDASLRDFGLFLRLSPMNGLMLLVQNPFLTAKGTGDEASLSYQPEMGWQQDWGPFMSDIACIGPYKLSGDRIPSRIVPEWILPPESVPNDGADRGEIKAFADCVKAFLITPSPFPISVEVGWTLNDYQIDVNTPEGRTEYKRIIDVTSNLGIRNLLYGPADYSLARIPDDTDSWNWEHILWLDLGQQIRKGKWDPSSSPMPTTATEMLDYAKSKNVGLLAYVYPSVPFSQDSSWLVTESRSQSKNAYASLASREFQDYLIHQLVVFKNRTGISGYSFDYTFLNLPGSSSYSQWWGWRRVLETLRKSEPGIVIDGRQTYQNFGPWSWLAGTYPHPTGNDEQPESFTPYPDLHFDRVSADRMRYVNYWYRNYQFAPEEIIPGYMTHQTERSMNVPSNESGGGGEKLVFSTFRARDWDYLGYRYSVISSIGTGGWNNVMDMIPARDLDEAKYFSAKDKAWIRYWLDWTTKNRDYLRHTRSILGQPAIGKADGTSALIGDGGYIFLFNPNYERVSADFKLDESIGLSGGKSFLMHEVYPEEGGLIGKPGAGLWSYGDSVHLQLGGTSATVFKLEAVDSEQLPLIVFGTRPQHNQASLKSIASVSGETLRVEHVSGEPGSQREIGVLLPSEKRINDMTVNGHHVHLVRNGPYVSAQVEFAGQAFAQAEQIQLNAGAPDGSLSGTFSVPQRIFTQLAARRENWPIEWTLDDYNTTWLVPERLLLFLQIVEPKETMTPNVALDGRPLNLLKAYSSVRAHAASLVGFYADLSHLAPDVQHKVTLKLPGLSQGQIRGLFFDNVEPEYTEAIAK